MANVNLHAASSARRARKALLEPATRWGAALRVDVPYALRALLRTPIFATVVVVTLALSVGVNAAILSLVEPLWFRVPRVLQPERVALVQSERGNPSSAHLGDSFRAQALEDIRSAPALAGAAAELATRDITNDFRPRAIVTSSGAIEPTAVSTEYFRVLGVGIRGSGFQASRADAASVQVVLSDDLWRREFDRGDVLGHEVRLGRVTATVVGIAPAGFQGPLLGSRPDLWFPLEALRHFAPIAPGAEHIAPVRVYVRLRDNAGLPEARAQLTQHLGRRVNLVTLDVPAYPTHLAAGFHRDATFVMFLAATFVAVLLLGCVNLAALFAARAERRRQDIATRLALGISRSRLICLLVHEIVIVSLVGGVAALLVASWILDAMSSAALPSGLTVAILQPTLNADRVWLCLAAALVMSLVAGLRSAFTASRTSPRAALQASSSLMVTTPVRGRTATIAAHVALSVMLSVVALVFVHSVVSALTATLGFDSDRTLSMVLQPRLEQYSTASGDLDLERRSNDLANLLDGIRSLPGVMAAAFGPTPLQPYSNSRMPEIAVTVAGSTRRLPAQIASVTAGYFAAAGIPILSGRDVTSSDEIDAAPGVVVNETLGRLLWPDDSAVGKVFAFGDQPPATVIAVVRDAARRGVRSRPVPVLYRVTSMASTKGGFGFEMMVRTHGKPAALVARVRELTASTFPEPSQLVISTTDEEVSRQLGSERLAGILFSGFGIAGLALTAVGVYGIVSFMVATRAREHAIRLALGAEAGRIVLALVCLAMTPVAVGCGVGTGLALLLVQLLRTYLPDVSALAPALFLLPTAIVLSGAAVASYLGASSIVRLELATTLREQ